MLELNVLERELKRKIIHISGSIIPILYIFGSWDVAVLILSICFFATLFIEWQRLKYNWQISFARAHERLRISGALYFAFSALFAVLFFKKEIAISALLMLAIGDSISGIIGAAFEVKNFRVKEKRKPAKLFIIMLAICFFLAYFFLPFEVALLGAVIAAIADSFPLKFFNEILDDNLAIPILSGTAMSIAIFLK
jgi:dolichol kinase